MMVVLMGLFVSSFPLAAMDTSNVLTILLYICSCVPFLFDSLITGVNVAQELRGDQATITEIKEEEFTQASSSAIGEDEKAEVSPSERILPEAIRSVTPLNNILTSNWKDGAFEQTNST